jgi:hypothetical protein
MSVFTIQPSLSNDRQLRAARGLITTQCSFLINNCRLFLCIGNSLSLYTSAVTLPVNQPGRSLQIPFPPLAVTSEIMAQWAFLMDQHAVSCKCLSPFSRAFSHSLSRYPRLTTK